VSPGGTSSEELSSGLNPLAQALIEQATGRSLLSGAPIKQNAFVNAVENIPQVSLVRAKLCELASTQKGERVAITAHAEVSLPRTRGTASREPGAAAEARCRTPRPAYAEARRSFPSMSGSNPLS
jgi:hypothetical protein